MWTGSEMIAWGGGNSSSDWNDGGRYNPAANSWTALPATGAPTARDSHMAVWTGSEMIVWGGEYWNGSGYAPLNDGGRYNPAANSWMAVPIGGAPAARAGHTAVWTGSEMIVWGGLNGISGYYYFNDGGRYSPTANSWTAVPGPAAAREWHTAVWTGSEMIVWGGYGGSFSGVLNDGGRYNPAANSWTAVPTNGAPAARYDHTAVWTGSEMIVWGGLGSSKFQDGGRYNPAANGWTAVPTNGAPAARYGHTAVWTGSEMIVWGGYNGSFLNDGGRYDPAANSWTALPTNGALAGRELHTAVWTASEMIVWGGEYWNGSAYAGLNDGARYNPAGNSWMPLTANGAPTARYWHTAVWTGNEMIVWGGNTYSSVLNDGARYDPVGNSWVAVPTNGAPAARYAHTVVWTGSEMIIWGGSAGGRYSPAANCWTAVPTIGAPAARYGHTAVWTGSEMILFGGQGNSGYLSDTWSYYPYAPAVRISRSGPTSAVVAWPVWSSTLRLCQTTNLAAGQWTTVTNAATQVGPENHVTVSPLSSGQFFRAQYP